MNRLLRFWKPLLQISLYFILFVPAILLYKNKHYWLISERGTDARDNGYWMFKYLRKEHPEINTVFLIDSASPDVSKVQHVGPTLKPRSLKHWLIFIAADVRMSTHLFLFAPAPYVGVFIKRHHTKRTINIDLQHGITHNTFPSTYRHINGSDLYICGAKPEYDWVIKEFGWDASSAKYTGFARFDGLHGLKTKHQILVMPTWRAFLRDASYEDFLASEYFAEWSNLLKSEELARLLETNDLSLVFYLHYSLQRFIDCFVSPSPRIIIASFDEYDVQTLLKESKLLITDYSSIFFDFAYMRKPVIYFQFDHDRFYSDHYQHGYFDHRENGFGPCAVDSKEVVREVRRMVSLDFHLEEKYIKRLEEFFPLFDTHNCERIYKAIIEKQDERKRRH